MGIRKHGSVQVYSRRFGHCGLPDSALEERDGTKFFGRRMRQRTARLHPDKRRVQRRRMGPEKSQDLASFEPVLPLGNPDRETVFGELEHVRELRLDHRQPLGRTDALDASHGPEIRIQDVFAALLSIRVLRQTPAPETRRQFVPRIPRLCSRRRVAVRVCHGRGPAPDPVDQARVFRGQDDFRTDSGQD